MRQRFSHAPTAKTHRTWCAILLLLAPAVAPGNAAIRLASGLTLQEAEDKIAGLHAMGYNPLEMDGEGDNRGVLALGFEYVATAHAAMSDLRDRGFPEATVVSCSTCTPESPFQYPQPSVPRLSEIEYQLVAPEAIEPNAAQQVYNAIANNDTEVALQQLRFLRANRTASDPLSGEIELRKAYLSLRLGNRD